MDLQWKNTRRDEQWSTSGVPWAKTIGDMASNKTGTYMKYLHIPLPGPALNYIGTGLTLSEQSKYPVVYLSSHRVLLYTLQVFNHPASLA